MEAQAKIVPTSQGGFRIEYELCRTPEEKAKAKTRFDEKVNKIKRRLNKNGKI